MGEATDHNGFVIDDLGLDTIICGMDILHEGEYTVSQGTKSLVLGAKTITESVFAVLYGVYTSMPGSDMLIQGLSTNNTRQMYFISFSFRLRQSLCPFITRPVRKTVLQESSHA